MAIHSLHGSATLSVKSRVDATDNNPRNGLASDDELKLHLAPLAAAAKRGDAQAFVNAYHAICWEERTAEEFERAIQWALTAGAHLTARALATTGTAQHPGHAELQKAARILAPPKLLRRLPSEPFKRLNHQWLNTNRTQYKGQWVALRNGHLLAASDSIRSLIEQVAIEPDILFTKVF